MGLRCCDGVVLGVEKLVVSKMLVEGSNRRIFNVDKHVGMVCVCACVLFVFVDFSVVLCTSECRFVCEGVADMSVVLSTSECM